MATCPSISMYQLLCLEQSYNEGMKKVLNMTHSVLRYRAIIELQQITLLVFFRPVF